MATPTKPAASSGGDVLTKPAGPLPLWGWLAVGGAAIYLYFRIFKAPAASSATSSAQQQPGPTGTAVVITPDMLGAGQGTASSTPATPTAPPPPTIGPNTLNSVMQQTATNLYSYMHPTALPGGENFQTWLSHANPQTQDFFHQIAASPTFQADPNAVEAFFAENQALKAQGLPYYSGHNIVNPQTGQQIAQTTQQAYWDQGGQQLPQGWLTQAQQA